MSEGKTTKKGLRPRKRPATSTRGGKRPTKGNRKKGAKKGAEKKPPRWKVWLKRLTITALTLALLGFIGLAGIFWYYGRDLPDVATLRDYAPPQTTRVLARDGEVLGEVFTERRTVIPIDEIPRSLIVATLAAEDADFYQHEGLDYPGIIRAVMRDVAEGRKAQGASTITQQVVKLLLLSPERTFARKIRELILARRLEQELTKDEILHLYLNHINYGHGRYGVQEAAQYYFGKDAKDLTLAEATLIAGVPQAPARLSPRGHREAAERRQEYVLRQLAAKREQYWPDLTLEAIEEAGEAEVELDEGEDEKGIAPELMTRVRRELRDILGEERYRRGGYTVHTTLDASLQRATREAVREGLRTYDARQRRQFPLREPRRRQRALEEVDVLREGRTYDAEVTGTDDEHGTIVLNVGGHEAVADLSAAERYVPEPEDDDAEPLVASVAAPVGARVRVSILDAGGEDRRAEARLEMGPQAAVIVLDVRTRDVLAVVGSYESRPGFDRATQALRQPGSTFKPLVYALGIQQRRFTPATVMIDAPAVYDQWNPQNYETWRHEGDVRIRTALAKSINLVAIRAIEQVGPEAAATFAGQLGIESELDPTLTLALGSSGVRPIEMVGAYASFAAGGRWAEPRFIDRVVGPDGEEIALPERAPARDVLTPAEAYVITSMLESVVQEGTGRRAQRLERPVAGKTGTSNEARDAWFVGYTPRIAAGVWVGFDDRRSLGRREGGGRTALPIWVDVIAAAEGDRPAEPFPRPSGVEAAMIDPATGLLAYEGMEEPLEEVFLEGTVPTETARPPEIADPSTFLMEQFGGVEEE
ncbi:MAG: PBP1A family penicillin-binding protein [Deltaproteobacteria bacterium]|nr:PBP1A family penicillin-binding protein [Deltaproteobacteria bacterium]